MTLDNLNLPDWLQTALSICNEMLVPMLSIIMSVLILVVTAVVKKKLSDKISEYKELIEILKTMNDKDTSVEVKSLQNKIDDMQKGFNNITSVLEIIFTNSNLPIEIRDKLAVVFSHVKSNDYEELLKEAKDETKKLKDQVTELQKQLENKNVVTDTSEEIVVNSERA